MKAKLKEVFQRFEIKALAGAMALSPLMVTTALATETPTFDLAEIMTTSATKIVGDLMKMIAAVLPVTIALLGASIGIAYGIKFIKSITKKAG